MPSPLLTKPLWQASDLGRAIPDSQHAVSVSLPQWKDVIAYEEKNPEVMNKLQSGYPRFVIHKTILALVRKVIGEQDCLPFPSAQTAEQCANFIYKESGATAKIIARGNLFYVTTTPAGALALKSFWQTTGFIVSTRQAQFELTESSQSKIAKNDLPLRSALAKLYNCQPDDVFLFPTGMAATFEALQTLLTRKPKQSTVQIGFPYVDTFKLQQKFGTEAILLHDLGKAVSDLQTLIKTTPRAGCFCEIPGNPLLGSADLAQIAPLLRKHQIPLVIDDVVATPFNIDVSPFADLIATSLTKYIAGSGDVMGGALICNPASPLYAELKALLQAHYEPLLWPEDAEVLAERIASFPKRMKIHNTNGLFIAEKLRNHPAVEKVWYPKWEHQSAYETVRRPDGGWGSLITFLTKNAEHTAPIVYDNLEICKGPSLGTDFSLVCPFALLAHYTELEWAEACGIPRNLIRISVGLEDPDELWARISRALDTIL